MTIQPNTNREFRRRLLAREPLAGAFVKTPHPIIVEVMAGAGYDFLVLDAEHAPFDRGTLDAMIFAGRASGCAMIIRVPVGTAEWIPYVLDCGAAGVMVPHVNSVAEAETLSNLMRYGHGGRGFTGTTRAAGYANRSMTHHLEETPKETVLIAQIEDPEGAASYSDIAAVDGVDALFVGRADLAVGSGIDDFYAPEILRQTNEVLRAKDAVTGLYCASGESLTEFFDAGERLFVVGSEHSAIRAAGFDLKTKIGDLPMQKDK